MIFTDKNHIDPKTGQPAKFSKIWIPANTRKDILSWYHAILCHPGQHTMIDRENRKFWTFTPPKSQILDFFEVSISKKCHSHKKTILHIV